MSKGALFWGCLLVTLGTILFLGQVGVPVHIPLSFLKVTPILLILAGLAIVIQKKQFRFALAAIAGALTGLWIGSACSYDSCDIENEFHFRDVSESRIERLR